MSDAPPPAAGWWQAADGKWYGPDDAPPTPPPPPESTPGGKGGNRLLWGAIVVVLVAALINGIAGDEDDESNARQEPVSERSATTSIRPVCCEVIYEVTGTARAVSITMETPTGTSQQDNVNVPLRTSGGERMSFRFSRGDFVYLSAQNEGDSGTVECKITGSNGQVISRASSRGAYVIAGCDGSAE